MPKNPKKVSKFIFILTELLQVHFPDNSRDRSIKIALNGRKMEQGYLLKIESSFN